MADLVNDFPKELQRQDPDTAAMVRVMEDCFTMFEGDILSLEGQFFDPRVMDERYLNMRFFEKGFTLFGFELTEAQKRRIHNLIPVINRQRGTLQGIENLIRLLLGLEASASNKVDDNADSWTIGVSEVGISTIIGIDNPSSVLEITFTVDLTDQDVRNVIAIVNYMRVAGTEVVLFYPNKPEVLIEKWEIGVSQIGVDTVILSEVDNYIYEQNYPPAGTKRDGFIN